MFRSGCNVFIFLGAGTSFPFGPYEAVPDWVNQNNRHAYYAAVSYVDEHIGETLAKLRAAKLYESTVVVVRLFPSSTPPSPPPSLCSMI